MKNVVASIPLPTCCLRSLLDSQSVAFILAVHNCSPIVGFEIHSVEVVIKYLLLFALV